MTFREGEVIKVLRLKAHTWKLHLFEIEMQDMPIEKTLMVDCAKQSVFSLRWSGIKCVNLKPAHPGFWFLDAQLEDLLIKCRSVMDGDHLVDEVSRIKH